MDLLGVCITWLVSDPPPPPSLPLAALAAAQWRYAVGEDREALTKVDRTETEEDKAAKEKVHIVEGADGQKLKLKVRGRGGAGRRRSGSSSTCSSLAWMQQQAGRVCSRQQCSLFGACQQLLFSPWHLQQLLPCRAATATPSLHAVLTGSLLPPPPLLELTPRWRSW